MRNTSSVRIAILKPSPDAPRRRSAGTRQPLKRSRASGCGAITSMRSAISKPGVSASTTNALMPRAPGASSVRAKTTYWCAMPPLEIQVFSPSSTYASPSSRAAHAIAATSDPASGSDSANAAIVRPLATSGRKRARCSGVPARLIAPEPSPCIANAKSASPECRASVWRIRQIVRVSITSVAPP